MKNTIMNEIRKMFLRQVLVFDLNGYEGGEKKT